MNFTEEWTRFSVDAEIERFGSDRLVDAHNKLVEQLRRERDAALADAQRLRDADVIFVNHDRVRRAAGSDGRV